MLINKTIRLILKVLFSTEVKNNDKVFRPYRSKSNLSTNYVDNNF